MFAAMTSADVHAQWTHYVVWPADDRPGLYTQEEIAKINQELFAKGNKKAAFVLGLAYMQGFGVPQDLIKAEEMFEAGAAEPDEKGMVGMFYAHGMYFPKNIEMAAHWYTAGGRPGDLFELAETYKAAGEADPEAAKVDYPKATALYLDLLTKAGQPEVRRAQMELGNFVIDGIYSAGNDSRARAQNLEWARIIAQELLGGEEYKIAIDYGIGREDLPKDETMWLRFCKRAAAYNIDLAQRFYADALNQGRAHDFSGYDYVIWTRLAAQKQTGYYNLLNAYTSNMNVQQHREADAAFDALVMVRNHTGAYYPGDDPLRDATTQALNAMPQDDPDVQLRRAFSLEKAAASDAKLYEQTLGIYRTVRNRRKMDVRFVLGRNLLYGRYGMPMNKDIAQYWLREAADEGSTPAKAMLVSISAH